MVNIWRVIFFACALGLISIEGLAATIIVTTTDDELFTDIILLASGTHLITLSGSGEDDNATGDFDITGDLIIQGTTNSIVSGNKIDRVFESSATLTLQNLRITPKITRCF